MGIFEIKIGFLPITIWDVLDILIVAYLMFQLYKLLRGSIALNILIGVLLLYVSWWLVTQLEMDLLSGILNQFVSVGVIVLIIIFQPEVRRFLLLLGNSTLRQRSQIFDRFLDRSFEETEGRTNAIEALVGAMLKMSRRRTGALIVLTGEANVEGIVSGGISMHADISEPLVLSIFNKESPMHDGAVIIDNGRITMASVILPVSENSQLPKSIGLRHRAAVGITERSSVTAFIVSEETGTISMAHQGQLERKIEEERLRTLLRQHFS